MVKLNKIIVSIVLLVVIINLNLIGIFADTTGDTEVYFFNSFNVPNCVYLNSFQSIWIETDGTSGDSRNPDPGVGCYRENGWPGPDCCPDVASKCNRVTETCGPGPTSCGELTESECNGNHRLAGNDLKDIVAQDGYVCNEFGDIYGPPEEGCSKYLSCTCQWNSGTDKCIAIPNHTIYDSTVNYPNGTFYTDNATASSECNGSESGIGVCDFPSFDRIDNCDTVGFIFREWTANWISPSPAPSYCTSGNDRIPCLDIVRLGFFGWMNFIVVILIIIVVYIFINKRK